MDIMKYYPLFQETNVYRSIHIYLRRESSDPHIFVNVHIFTNHYIIYLDKENDLPSPF